MCFRNVRYTFGLFRIIYCVVFAVLLLASFSSAKAYDYQMLADDYQIFDNDYQVWCEPLILI